MKKLIAAVVVSTFSLIAFAQATPAVPAKPATPAVPATPATMAAPATPATPAMKAEPAKPAMPAEHMKKALAHHDKTTHKKAMAASKAASS